MTSTKRNIGIALALLCVIGTTYYVFTAPYVRFPGVRLGGELTAAPSDWSQINGETVAQLKLAGFSSLCDQCLVCGYPRRNHHGVATGQWLLGQPGKVEPGWLVAHR